MVKSKIDIEIDHQDDDAIQKYHNAVHDWRRECLESMVSLKKRREGTRSVSREIQRKNYRVEDEEMGNKLIHTFKKGDKTISKLTITFLNFNLIPENHE